ncbi:mitogen-activated kinase kinase kinase YODA-like isoform X1 [Pyrrhoderma noxium]|uniref:non-specific serine/threonine protein kinase n=1 Tax=Pyrrhoderma noxium TaxID=2282107 RepID=A0A286UI28_9AGAM|nr:mitogen-activated kinase kinase kinase YODA-like isoform X1 [Pyrrhoderma noxium]
MSYKGLKVFDYVDYIDQGTFGIIERYRVPSNISKNSRWRLLKGREIAVKTLSTREKVNYKSEIKTIQVLPRSQGLLQYYGEIVDNGYVHIVMEYIEHGDLHKMTYKIPQVDPAEYLIILREIFKYMALGLRDMHAKSLVHQDIKPANVLIKSISPWQVVLADFGSLYAIKEDDPPDWLQTTYYYAAPEQVDGHYGNPKSDIWSLAMTFISIARGGKNPFEQEESDANVFDKIRNRTVVTYVSKRCFLFQIKEASELLYGMLKQDPKSRLSAEDVLNHAFIQGSSFSDRHKQGYAPLVRPPEHAPVNPRATAPYPDAFDGTLYPVVNYDTGVQHNMREVPDVSAHSHNGKYRPPTASKRPTYRPPTADHQYSERQAYNPPAADQNYLGRPTYKPPTAGPKVISYHSETNFSNNARRGPGSAKPREGQSYTGPSKKSGMTPSMGGLSIRNTPSYQQGRAVHGTLLSSNQRTSGPPPASIRQFDRLNSDIDDQVMRRNNESRIAPSPAQRPQRTREDHSDKPTFRPPSASRKRSRRVSTSIQVGSVEIVNTVRQTRHRKAAATPVEPIEPVHRLRHR